VAQRRALGAGALLKASFIDYGLLGRLAMRVYLATLGSDKVGFTLIGVLPDGQPQWRHAWRSGTQHHALLPRHRSPSRCTGHTSPLAAPETPAQLVSSPPSSTHANCAR